MLAVAYAFSSQSSPAAFWFLFPVLWLTGAIADLTHLSFESGAENFVFGVLVGSLVNVAICTAILLLVVRLSVRLRPKTRIRVLDAEES